MNKAIFLDRDGVINKGALEHEYITSLEGFQFLPGVLEALKRISGKGYVILVVTNQRAISLGKMSNSDLERIHTHMLKTVEEAGGKIEKVYFCPHGDGECNCRKPAPGMLDTAQSDYELCLEESWVIGDSISDVRAGKSRGCRTIYIGKHPEAKLLSDFSAKSLGEAIEIILQEK